MGIRASGVSFGGPSAYQPPALHIISDGLFFAYQLFPILDGIPSRGQFVIRRGRCQRGIPKMVVYDYAPFSRSINFYRRGFLKMEASDAKSEDSGSAALRAYISAPRHSSSATTSYS